MTEGNDVPQPLRSLAHGCAGAAAHQSPVQFRSERWSRWLSRAADPTLSRFGDDPNGLLSWLGLPASRLDRDHLRTLAGAADDPEGRLRLLVGVLAWGMGRSNARMMPGVVRLLDHPRRNAVLAMAATEAGAGRPAAAYRSWSLPGLGAPFFTKWLWACGCRANSGTPPMIRDGNVVRSLRTLGWDDRTAAGTRHRPERYEAYSAALHRWAAQLSERAPTSAEDLEFSLFWAAGDFSRLQNWG